MKQIVCNCCGGRLSDDEESKYGTEMITNLLMTLNAQLRMGLKPEVEDNHLCPGCKEIVDQGLKEINKKLRAGREAFLRRQLDILDKMNES